MEKSSKSLSSVVIDLKKMSIMVALVLIEDQGHANSQFAFADLTLWTI